MGYEVAGRKRKGMPPEVVAALNEQARQQAVYSETQPALEQAPAPVAADADLAFNPLTDLGNGERHAARCQGRFKWVAAIGWHYWDGRRWARQGADEMVAREAHRTARSIQDEAKAIRGTEDDRVVERKKNGREIRYSDKLSNWGRASESAARLAAIVKLSQPYLAAEADALDADPWRFNVLNGTLCIRREALAYEDLIIFKPHDPDDLITKLAPVIYDPSASCPRYDRFLEEVQPQPDMRRFLHCWGGYSLTGDVEEQKLTFWYGKGRNGKSTLVDSWGAVAGDYGETVPIETFTDQGRGRNAGQATPDLALLPGVRFLRTSEPEKNSKLAEALIKLVTGGEPIQARNLHGPYFKFRPAFKLTMGGNYRPTIGGTDEGIWRRVVLVPWTVTVANPDRHLSAALREEASGILNRLLDGVRDYLENGLAVPDAVADATQDYRDDSDPLGQFLTECVASEDGSRVSSRRMHELFIAWAKAAGEREWTAKGLAMALKERGFRSKHANGAFWLDHRLIRSEADFGVSASPHPSEGGDDG